MDADRGAVDRRVDVDVAVAGGGMAGLVAGVRAGERGADVLVVEKGPAVGGSMALSNGNVWTFEDMDGVREHVGGGDRGLQRRVVESFDDGLAWLDGQGVDLEPYDSLHGRGMRCSPEELTRVLPARIEDLGGRVAVSTELVGVDAGGPSDTLAVACRHADGDERVRVETGALVLATGGFQADEGLVRRHVAGESRYRLRSNPHSEGDGLRVAGSLGASSSELGGFYGHNVVAPPARIDAGNFAAATQYYGPIAVALDRDGERFVDESAAAGEERLARHTLERAGGEAVYVVDAARYERTYLRPVGETIEEARRLGGPVAEADSLRGLGDRLDAWGFDGEGALATLRAFNDAVRSPPGASDGELTPPRRRHRTPLDEPPFYAVEVRPGVTFTTGGLRVDGGMRVLDGGDPIDGLWAAGVDVGDVHRDGYMGGLATALVTGLVAGSNAAERTVDTGRGAA